MKVVLRVFNFKSSYQCSHIKEIMYTEMMQGVLMSNHAIKC